VPEEALQLAVTYEMQALEELYLGSNRLEKTSFLLKCTFPSLITLDLSWYSASYVATSCLLCPSSLGTCTSPNSGT
jgi:hypothetical protein